MANGISMEKYSGTAQLLHWLISPLIILQFILAWSADAMERGDTQTTLYLTHKSIGMTVLILAVLRLVWRLLRTPPDFPGTMSVLEQWTARLTHWGLYVLILVMPLSGWLMSSTAERSTQWFGLFTFPDLMGKSESLHEFFEEAHELLAWVLFTLALFHIVAALWHAAVKKDGILQRMLP